MLPPMDFQRPPADFQTYLHPSPFPPSFDGNPWAYGFGLFGDVVASALALYLLLTYLLEDRRARRINDLLRNPLKVVKTEWRTPLFIYRSTNVCLLTFVFMRCLPDALWMLAWGEVSDTTIRTLLALDLWSDGLALVPFLLATLFWAWGRQVIPQRLSVETLPCGDKPLISGRVPWDVILKNGRIVLIVLLIAIGVTIGKASA